MSELTKDAAITQAMDFSPEWFRQNLWIDVGDKSPTGKARYSEIAEPWQLADLKMLDPCILWLAGLSEKHPKIKRFFWQRARGHSKTSDMGMQITWLLWASRNSIDGLVFAEDREQAELLREQMHKIKFLNPWLTERLDYQRKRIVNKQTGAQVKFWSSDAGSSYGITPDFVICDELTHWSKHDTWVSVFSSFSKKAKMFAILCNAGWGYDWKWNIREYARKHPELWHFSAHDGCVASWISQEVLDENRAVLPHNEFERLWMNRWQEAQSIFLTMSEVQACRDPELKRMTKTKVDGWPYVAAVDFAPKHDRTVGVVTHRENQRIIVDTMDVICPKARRKPTETLWCYNWMKNVQERFGGKKGHVYFIIDQYQLMTIKEQLTQSGFDIEEFEFGSGVGNWQMSWCLQQCILNRIVRWYPGCGSIKNAEGRIVEIQPEVPDDLESELVSLVLKPYSNGRKWRFDHIEDQLHHDDRAFALGAACKFFIENAGYDDWGLTPPDQGGGFNWGQVNAA